MYRERIQDCVFTGGMLADACLNTSAGGSLATQLASWINTPNCTVYDRAIDCVYLQTHTGGSNLHHLIDEQHDIFGAFDAAARALPDDSLWQEVMGTATHLGKDLFSASGLPVVSLEPETYHQANAWLRDVLHLPGDWLGDFLQINGLELFSGVLAVAAIAVGCQNADMARLAELSAASGLAGALAANPIGMCAAAIALVMAWKQLQGRDVKQIARPMLVGAGTVGAVSLAGYGMAALGLSSGLLPSIGCLLISMVIGLYVRKFLSDRLLGERLLVSEDKSLPPPQLQLENHSRWDCPSLADIKMALSQFSYPEPYPMSDPVRQMLRNRLESPGESKSH